MPKRSLGQNNIASSATKSRFSRTLSLLICSPFPLPFSLAILALFPLSSNQQFNILMLCIYISVMVALVVAHELRGNWAADLFLHFPWFHQRLSFFWWLYLPPQLETSSTRLSQAYFLPYLSIPKAQNRHFKRKQSLLVLKVLCLSNKEVTPFGLHARYDIMLWYPYPKGLERV